MSSSSPPAPHLPSNASPPESKSKLPAWLPISAFIGTSLALAIPLLMIRKSRSSLTSSMNKAGAAPPPRRSGPSSSKFMPGRSTPFPVQATKPKMTAEKPDFTSPSTGELLSAISKADTSTAMYAGKAFAIATGLVTVFGVGLTLGVSSFMGVNNAHDFGQRMRAIMWATLPSLSARIHRSPETQEEHQALRLALSSGMDSVTSSSVIDDSWTWEEAEKRLQKAYDEGGFPLWMQAALREMEAEVEVERRKREPDAEHSSR
ncbi:hypothetical protein BDQ12DRAFT_738659 [Crucibulum laeve]|uniref:Uncharacterized protein n=1 Tax=Crucibulum laeve TaxID=68775 RepID=A0A5C3LLP0_9AGAR|nr:hypothetical protein BDQ12DRAFT_738659 [Crucibulum laeve]